jgi:hydrogenase nickel incorporation protein HypB
MCTDCGCGDSHLVPVDVHESLLAHNAEHAAENRARFAEAGVLAVNLMGSPGAGKTALLEATARAMDGRMRLAAVSGDLATEKDADRLKAAGIPSAAITTGSACHLDAELVDKSLASLPWRKAECFFIENVGNLVCPAVYDLGQAVNVVALSVAEGEDKPLKYPPMFMKADLVLLTKVDLLPHLPDFSVKALEDNLARVMPEPAMLRVSASTGEGVDRWIKWLGARRLALKAGAAGVPAGHRHG